MKAPWQLLALGATLLICLGLAQTQQGHVVLRDVGLYETPATYTELAFSQPGDLPETLTKPNSDIKVSFSIHNVSTDLRSYQWSIVLVSAGKSHVQATGTVLSPAQSQTLVSRSVGTTCAGSRLQVVVRLASPAQSISFWMNCPSTAANTRGKQ
jgi:hypothetical protein